MDSAAVALFLPGQVVESLETDEEFVGFGMVLSQDFTDSLNLPVSLKERLFIKNTQFYSVSEEVLDALSSVYRQNNRRNIGRPFLLLHISIHSILQIQNRMHSIQIQERPEPQNTIIRPT